MIGLCCNTCNAQRISHSSCRWWANLLHFHASSGVQVESMQMIRVSVLMVDKVKVKPHVRVKTARKSSDF